MSERPEEDRYVEKLEAQVAALTQERDAALAREQALREALEKISGLAIRVATGDRRAGYHIWQLTKAALQNPDAPTEE